jgi:hypothetical protein
MFYNIICFTLFLCIFVYFYLLILFLTFKERLNSMYINAFMYDTSLYLNRSLVPISNIVYGPYLGANNFRRRPGFRNKI